MTTRIRPDTLANTAVTAGTYGGTTVNAVVTVDAQGRLTYAANATPSIATTQLTGTIIASQVANNQTYGINVTGNSGTVTNGVYTSGSYSDPSWLTLTKSKVGLSNVDNTADSSKSVSYASTAGSAPASDVYTWAKAATKPSYTKSDVGLGNVDNTADANKSVNYASTAGSANTATSAGNAPKAWVIFDGTPNATAGDVYCTVLSSYNVANVVKRTAGGLSIFTINMSSSVAYDGGLGGYLGVTKVTQTPNATYGTLAQQVPGTNCYGAGFASTSQATAYVNYPTTRILVEVWW